VVTIPAGRGARIYARRWRDEVTYFWIFYNRGGGWLEDGPPFVSIDPHAVKPGDTLEYVARTSGAFSPVPGGSLKIRVQARGKWLGKQDRCIKVVASSAADRTTLQYYTGKNEPYNLEVSIVYT
jgi:hypothetical protein